MKLIEILREKLKRYDDETNFTCDICGREVFDGARVCDPCRGELPWNNGAICLFCGRKVKEEGACMDCKLRPLGVVKARSVFCHEGEAARLVVRFKRGERYLFRTLAELSVPLIEREFGAVEALIPVPMSENSRKKRGYNQSELLAECIAERTGKTVIPAVIKQKDTPSQKFLTRREREQNLESSFHVKMRKEVKGKRVLIVDDTLTTGATISALADLLKRAGAAEVFAFTFTGVEHKT